MRKWSRLMHLGAFGFGGVCLSTRLGPLDEIRLWRSLEDPITSSSSSTS